METTTMKVCRCCGRELPVEQFVKNAFGLTNVCHECNSRNRSEAAKRRKNLKQQAIDALNARNLRLSDFTPRELMEELHRRGYEGKLKITHVEEIDITNF